MVRESEEVKKRKVTGLSRLVSEMVKSVREAGFDMLKDLVNQIIVKRFIPAE